MQTKPVFVLGRDPEADQVFAALGIELAHIVDGVGIGEFSRSNASEFAPPSFAGTHACADTLVALSEVLVPLGWTRKDPDGISLLVHPDGKRALNIQLGNENVGNPQCRPLLKYRKGDGSQRLIDRQSINTALYLPAPGMAPQEPEKTVDEYDVWYVLRYRPEGPRVNGHRTYQDHVMVEVSMPSVIDPESGQVRDWEMRIIIGRIDLSGPTQGPIRKPDDRGDSIDIVDVPVTRK